MEKEQHISGSVHKDAERTDIPSSAENDTKMMRETEGQPLQFACDFEWESCGRRGRLRNRE